MKKRRRGKEKEIEELKSKNRKLVQQIKDIFYMLHEEFLISKDELPELLDLLKKQS